MKTSEIVATAERIAAERRRARPWNQPSESDIMGRASSQAEAREDDVVIKPDVGEVGAMGFEARKHAIEMGEHTALAKLPSIRDVLKLRARR